LSLGGDRDRDTATLFMALEQVASANPDVDVLVQTRSSLRPPKGVRLVKHMSHAEVRNAYAAASVVVVATRMNSHVSGMTVSLEAGASARPVVITKTPGIEDYVIDQVTGLLSPVGNPQSLARHVNALLQDEQRCSEMGIRARAYVAHRHSSKAMVESIGEMICDL
jgi:glycosyltransferase involved in cell wall biosynthesis